MIWVESSRIKALGRDCPEMTRNPCCIASPLKSQKKPMAQLFRFRLRPEPKNKKVPHALTKETKQVQFWVRAKHICAHDLGKLPLLFVKHCEGSQEFVAFSEMRAVYNFVEPGC